MALLLLLRRNPGRGRFPLLNAPPTGPVHALGFGPLLISRTRHPRPPLLPPPRPPLPLPRPPHPRPHRRLPRPLLQAPPLLPLPPPVPPPLSPSLTFRPFSSQSGSERDDHQDPDPNANFLLSDDVDRVCSVISDLFASPARNMEAVLDEIAADVDLGPPLVLAVLDRFQHAHRPAYRFFKWVKSRPGFAHDTATCCRMLSVFGRTRQFQSMVGFLEEMGKGGLLSMDAFKVSIKAFASAKEMRKAVGVLKLMKRFDFDAGIEEFNCLVDSLVKAKLAKEADELVEKMRDEFIMDFRTYTMVLHGYCEVKNLVEAGRVWNEMLDRGFKLDAAAYNIMLEGLIKGQRRPEAIKLFELMKAKGPAPNTRTYTILIQDLCKALKMERAVACFDEMIRAGCAPDIATYTCLIIGFGNSRQMDKVSGLLREMSEKGCPADGRTYNALIKLMTNRNMPEDAVRIYKMMIKNGFEPTIHTYNMMMKSFFRCKNYEMGCEVWKEMAKKGICPDVNSYTVLIGGHIRYGRVDAAYKYIEEMMNKGMKAPEIDYNKFAADFTKAGKPDVLRELAKKVKFTGKIDASDVLNDWAERTKNGIRKRVINQTGERLF